MLQDIGLGTALRALLAALDDQLEAVYAAHGEDFRPRYFVVWRHLDENGEAGVAELAARAQVSQPAMTQTLAAMKRAGLVAMEQGEDRRRRVVRLTATGEATGARLGPIFAATRRAAERLEQEAGTDLAGTIESVLAVLRERPFAQRIEAELEAART